MPAPSSSPPLRDDTVGPLHATVRGVLGLLLLLHALAAVDSMAWSFAELAVSLTLLSTAVTRSCPLCRIIRRLRG